MGYLLGGDTSWQEIFMLVGPLRSGKGTIGRLLTDLLAPPSSMNLSGKGS